MIDGNRKSQCMLLATANGYTLEEEQENIGLLIFTNGGVQVNVYTTRMTVGTVIHHPKQGATQLFRRRVSWPELDKIFKNPRVHTGHGYHRKTA